MNPLTQTTLLARQKFSLFGNNLKDDDLTDEVHRKHNMSDKAGKYSRCRLPDDCLKPIRQIRSAAKSDHEKQTFVAPFGSIIPASRSEAYLRSMAAWKDQWDAAVRRFIDNYASYKQRARLEILKDAYREEDYPAAHTLPDLFCFDYGLLPLPNPDALDAVPGLSDARVQMLKDQLAQATQLAGTQARNQLMERITEKMNRLFQSLYETGPDGQPRLKAEPQIHARTLENLNEILELAPQYNMTEDSTISRLVADARRMLNRTQADLRDSAIARTSTAAALSTLATSYGLNLAPRKLAAPAAPKPTAPTAQPTPDSIAA
jgi:hypothetical protein